MDPTGDISINPEVDIKTVVLNNDLGTVSDSNLAHKPNIAILQNQTTGDIIHIKTIAEDIPDEALGHQKPVTPTMQNISRTSPDQLNDLQSYLVTFNKEIGNGGQPGTFSIGDLDGRGIPNAAKTVIYSGGQIISVSPSLQVNQEFLSLQSEDRKIGLSGDSIDPQTQTLRIAEALSDNGVLLQQNQELSTLSTDTQRTVMLQGLPGATGTLVQVNVPGTCNSKQKVVPVMSSDGKEQMHLSLDSLSPVMPQLVQVSQSQGTITLRAAKPEESMATESASSESVQIGHADITNAQLIAFQGNDANTQLVAVNNPQELNMLTNPQGVETSGGFQTVSIVPASNEQGNEMNYLLIVSQADGEKDGEPKQYALDMGMLKPQFDFNKEGREVMEEVVDEDGSTRKILHVRLNAKELEVIPSASTQLQCHYCSYTAPKRYLMLRHMKTHSEDRPYQCNLCEKSFKTHASLQNHVNTHTGIRPHKCKDCEMAFTTSGELVRHIRYKHTFEKPHKCTECDYASVELSKLKRHMRSHTGERPYQCPHCTYASPDTYKLKRHLRIHTGEKPYECDVCHARFTQSNSLKAHKLIHSGMKPVFQCDLCPTTCGRKTDLKIHMMKLHSNDKPVECKKCGMCFNDRYSFKLHLKSHDGEKCFKCDHCEYAALSQRHLESHLLTHTGEKPFECDECVQTFRQKQLLKRHKNLYHTEDYTKPEPKEKNFDCSLCDKQFANKGNLLRHMQNHDPEFWNKKLSEEGSQSSMSTEDLIQGTLLNDLREGKLGIAPKVVIVHPNGNVEEVTSRLQTLAQEKQMEELMIQVVNEGGVDGAERVSPSIEEAIKTQVEAVLKAQAEKGDVDKTGSGDEATSSGLKIVLEKPSQSPSKQPTQTYSREEIESAENQTGSLSNASWENKTADHVIVVKPIDRRGEEMQVEQESSEQQDELIPISSGIEENQTEMETDS